MASDSARHLAGDKSVVALHACGDLHVRLMQLASQQGCRQLAVAPCCYNRIAAPQYQALSTAAQASSLQLSVDDLGLPLSETVTAGARVRRQRDTSMARRLGFDLLQRQQRQSGEYLPTPSLPVAWLEKPFEQYCRDLADLKQLPLTGNPDWAALEVAGWQRLAEVRNLERVRNLFRRPLELWLVLDRAPVPRRTRLRRSPGPVLRLSTDPTQPAYPRGTRPLAAAQPVDKSVNKLLITCWIQALFQAFGLFRRLQLKPSKNRRLRKDQRRSDPACLSAQVPNATCA